MDMRSVLLVLMFFTVAADVRAQASPQPLPKGTSFPNQERMIVRRGIRVDRQADLTATRHPVIQIELYSEGLFDGYNQIHSLRIGSHEFTNFQGLFGIHQVVFELTPQEFAKTRSGDLVVVRYGPRSPIGYKRLLRSWQFGRLNKDQVNQNPVRTFTGTSVGDSPSYSIDGKLIHAGSPIKIRSKTVDTRTHIPIISVNENIFPEQWLSRPIQARGLGLSRKELKRSIYNLDVAMSKYSILLLRENIKAIYLLRSLTLYGVAADATHSEDSIYIVNAGSKEYTDEYLESLFHQAFSNLMLQKNDKGREPSRWQMPRFAPQKSSWKLPAPDPQMKLVYESNEDGREYVYALENTGFTGVTLLKQFRQVPPVSAIRCPLPCQQTNPTHPERLRQAIKEHGFVISKTVLEDAPVWSHDGKQIAFRSNRDSDSAELYVTQVDGTNLRRLTYTRHFAKLSSSIGAICWSPDDRRLAFVLQDEFGSNLFVVNSDGTGQEKLPIVSGKQDGIDGEGLSVDSVDRLVGWLPDGRILVVTQRFSGGRTLYSILRDGTGLTPLSEKSQVVADALVSPDENHIAIKTLAGLIVKDLRTNSVRYSGSPEGVHDAAWSPDSKRIAYSGYGLTILDLETGSAFGIAATGPTNKLIYSPLNPRRIVSGLVWSPDSKQIAYVVESNVGVNSPSITELRLVNADGSNDHKLAAGAAMSMWSPDGRYIIFSRQQARIYLIKPDGTGERYIGKGIYPRWLP
jgi:Tol biopolymer transport system component